MAPWSTSLITIGIGSFILLMAIALLLFAKLHDRKRLRILTIAVLLSIVVGAALFSVRGYEVTNRSLYIRHLGWSSKIELTNLVDAKIDPQAIEKSSRVWGNGGLFSFTGSFRNSRLGTFQVYATDPDRAVVLRLPERTVVVTPDDPDRFIHAVFKNQSM
jgi:hypothetical protein